MQKESVGIAAFSGPKRQSETDRIDRIRGIELGHNRTPARVSRGTEGTLLSRWVLALALEASYGHGIRL